jgi:hypothetical protein
MVLMYFSLITMASRTRGAYVSMRGVLQMSVRRNCEEMVQRIAIQDFLEQN